MFICTMSQFLTTAFLLFLSAVVVDSARILGVYPIPSISHQVVFRALTLELVKRGHEVVTITSDPVFKDKQPPANLKEIDISGSYKLILHMFGSTAHFGKSVKRGVIMDYNSIIDNDWGISYLVNNVFEFDVVQTLIEDKNQKFDLVIVEGIANAPLIFGKIFNAPIILFSSLYGTASNYETIGAVARHPLVHAHIFRNKFRFSGIFEKINQLYLEYRMWKFEKESEIADNIYLKSRFGSDAPTVAELQKKVALLLVNSHPIFDGNRPVPPAAVYLGALHLQPAKELPQDLKLYLDNSSRGVVYVSLGTNVRPSTMEKEFLDEFLDAFEKLPYDILWKFDGELYRMPKNLKIQKWFPQRDLLMHPKVKVFVMQGGLQSTDEAIDAEVPLVGIPMLGDQWYNTDKYVELGIGVQLDSYTMVAEDLVNAVNTVIRDTSYKTNVKKLKAIIQDQPEKPIDRAVWWTEHVLRHKGSLHLIGASTKLSTSEYFLLDVLLFLGVVFSVATIFVLIGLYYIIGFIKKINKTAKIKKN